MTMDTFDIVGIQIKVMTTTINFLIIADGNADNEKLITYLDINGKSRFQISRRSTIPSYRRKQKTKKDKCHFNSPSYYSFNRETG